MLLRNKRCCSMILTLTLMIGVCAGCGNKKGQTLQDGTVNANGSEVNATSAEITEDGQNQIQYPLTVTDQIGREVTFSEPVNSIVSSYYISTAITIALGKEDALTGVEMKAETRELYQLAAPQIIELPAVGSGKGINVEEIAKINPDVVVLPKKLQDSVEQLEKLNIPVLVVDPETLDDYMECVSLLGTVYGEEERASQLLTYYKEKISEVEKLTHGLSDLPKVYMGAGSSYYNTCTSQMYQNELIAMAGGENVSAELKDSYWAEVSPEHLLSWNPDYIFAVSYAEYSLDNIRNDAALQSVQAVKENQVYTFPSEIEPWDYPTPSSILGILWLTHVLHEDLYSKEDYVAEAESFYQTYFDIQVTEEQLGIAE